MSTVRRLNMDRNNRKYKVGDKTVRITYDEEEDCWIVYVDNDTVPLAEFPKEQGDAVIEFLDELEAYDLAIENPKEGLKKTLADICGEETAKEITEELGKIIKKAKKY